MAQGYDAPGDERVLSLAHAVSASPAFRLGGFFDIQPARAEAAERKWSCPRSPRERTVWLNQPWDVVCIATPDSQHAADLRDALARKPRGILVEKPVAADLAEGLELLQEAQRLGVAVVVDFPRRCHTGVAAVAEHVAAGRLGRPVAVVFAYSGHPVSSAIHMLDLFHTWWGGDWEPAFGWRRGPHTALTLSQAGYPVTASFVNLPAEPYYVWELHVYCERGKVQLSASPEVLEVSRPALHPSYRTHQVLTPLARFPMEEEALLPRILETLREMIADPEVARPAIQREIDSQIFSSRVLRCLLRGGA